MSDTAGLLALCAAYYVGAGLAICLGYHRVLSHRSLVLGKGLERVLVTLGLPAGTPVQWAGNHRFHHAHADRPEDPHSPLHGFWHAHNGWYIGRKDAPACIAYGLAGPVRVLFDGWHRPRTNQQHAHLAPDVARDPWYRFVSRPGVYFSFALAHVALFFGGAFALFGARGVAAMWLTLVLVYNIGDAIDSVAHVVGAMPYGGPDRARNHWVMGLICLGDGWHANHHRFPWSARHGLEPGQWDWTWGVIRALRALGLARDVRVATPEQVRAARAEIGAGA
ncbi:MAG TPA: fatty acid desaturase [Polyangia bacterium]|jgi:stearoyl-CoA desaturase (delta-9 desaturase)|nr:fatty acid desaturase [Polyangia bacterium]